MKKTCTKPSEQELLSSMLTDLRQPFKTRSVRDWEAKHEKTDLNAPGRSGRLKRVLISLMAKNFKLSDLVYNRVTKEDGIIRRVYKMDGAAMCEVGVPIHSDSWAAGYNISDWAEDVLQPSTREGLESPQPPTEQDPFELS